MQTPLCVPCHHGTNPCSLNTSAGARHPARPAFGPSRAVSHSMAGVRRAGGGAVDRRGAHREQLRPLAFAELQPAVRRDPLLRPAPQQVCENGRSFF
jgi:hypothetical protein